MLNEAKLNQLIGQMLSDLGGASSVAMVRIGDALGLYKALHTKGAMTAREPGCFELPLLRSRHAQICASRRAGNDLRCGRQPGLFAGWLRLDGRDARQPAQGGGGVPQRRRGHVGRAGWLYVLRGSALLPPRLPQQFDRRVAPGPRWYRRED